MNVNDTIWDATGVSENAEMQKKRCFLKKTWFISLHHCQTGRIFVCSIAAGRPISGELHILFQYLAAN